MNKFAASVALAGVLVVTALSPAAAGHLHYVYARLGAGVCSGYTCTGAFFPTAAAAWARLSSRRRRGTSGWSSRWLPERPHRIGEHTHFLNPDAVGCCIR